MMQSRLTALPTKYNWALSFSGLRRRLVFSPTGRTVDPSTHAVDDNDSTVLSGKPEKSQDVEDPENIKANNKSEPSKDAEFGPLKKPRHASSSRLESTVIGQPSNPITQQKRTNTTILDDVSCVGIDGTPWPGDKEDRRKERKETEDYDREYYKHHKASPLSEIEFADTRKPITQATDAPAGSGYFGDEKVVVWLPEQLDTAEEALRRATEIWKENAMRGDPDAPHSRVLRNLRGEWF